MFEYPVLLKYITAKFILDKEPISIIRIGNVEGSSLLNEPNPQLTTNAGFYGNYEDYERWKQLYIKGIKNSDIISYVVS